MATRSLKKKNKLNTSQKIQPLQIASETINKWRTDGTKIVFTNGCFDILHYGHVDYLEKAASLGDKLILGLNTDASVKRQGKGDDRPINNEESRARVLAALGFVDLVILFEEQTPEKLIRSLKPDILVKGSDYLTAISDPKHPQYIVGSDIVKAYGGSVETVPLVEGYSTTKVIQKILRTNDK